MQELVLKDLEKTLRSAKLLGFEIPKKVHLINDTFANLGLATATHKLKRHEAKIYFKKEIDGMY
jgi:long-chain acyl-CoA synthetase